jgi:glycosyltransferase involved in cell wall biosynthesis
VSRPGVMHLVDTLSAGGAERMCVQLANALPRDRFAAHVCATRRSGPLESEIAPHVRFLDLRRRSRFDALAILRLRRYVKQHGIRILHAHGTSAFTAVAVRALTPGVAVVWHDHYGRRTESSRAPWPYRLLRRGLRGVIVVNDKLRAWAGERLHVPREQIWLLPNFVARRGADGGPGLPGNPEFRVVQIANLRPPKDHPMMLRAMRRIADAEPRAHLLLVGHAADDEYGRTAMELIRRLGLASHVSVLGLRDDVPAIVRQCAVGVLSSASEGLPLALLEYGEAGIAVVSTAVGDCRALLEPLGGGCLVEPGDSDGMAEAVLALLRDPERRRRQAEAFRAIVRKDYSEEAAIRRVVEIYDHALA